MIEYQCGCIIEDNKSRWCEDIRSVVRRKDGLELRLSRLDRDNLGPDELLEEINLEEEVNYYEERINEHLRVQDEEEAYKIHG